MVVFIDGIAYRAREINGHVEARIFGVWMPLSEAAARVRGE